MRELLAGEQRTRFEEFARVSARRLYRTAYLLMGGRHLAEDLVQMALERTARHWDRIETAPEAYARTVLANLSTDWWRRRGVRPRETLRDPPEAGAPDDAGRVVVHMALIAALRELTRRQRAVLVLRYFDDLTEAETARVLGVTVGTVKRTASRALGRMRAVAESHDLDRVTGEPVRRKEHTS